MNFTTDDNRSRTINNYCTLVTSSKSHIFTTSQNTGVLSISTLRLRKDLIETVLHADWDDSTGKSALFNWKAVPNLYDVLNMFQVMILRECSIDLKKNFTNTSFPFFTICQGKTCQNLGSHLVEADNCLGQYKWTCLVVILLLIFCCFLRCKLVL